MIGSAKYRTFLQHPGYNGGGGAGDSKEARKLYEQQAETAKFMLGLAKDNLPGALGNFTQATNQYFDPAFADRTARQANADAQRAIATNNQAMQQNLARYGMNPNSGRFASMANSNAIQGAALQAGAMQKARNFVQDKQLGASKDLFATMTGLQSDAANAAGSAAQGFSGLANNAQQANAATWSGVGSVARLGWDMYKAAADGGYIDGYADGGGVDTVLAKYGREIEAASAETGIPADRLARMIFKESSGNARARSNKGAQGLMQLLPATAREVGVRDVYSPADNIMGGARYLKKMVDQFGDEALALAAYNAGPGNVRKHGGIPRFRETVNYVADIMGMEHLPETHHGLVRGKKGSGKRRNRKQTAPKIAEGAMTYAPQGGTGLERAATRAPNQFNDALPVPPAPSAAPMLQAGMQPRPNVWEPVTNPQALTPTTYTIQKGDTLSHIARRHGTTVEELARRNGIRNPNRIMPGQQLSFSGGGLVSPMGKVSQSPTPQVQAPQASPLPQMAKTARDLHSAATGAATNQFMGNAANAAATAADLTGSQLAANTALNAAGASSAGGASSQAAMLAAQNLGLEGATAATVNALGAGSSGATAAAAATSPLLSAVGTVLPPAALLGALYFMFKGRADGGYVDGYARGGQVLNTKSSMVDYLKSKGMDSSFATRKKVYEAMYGEPYKGTAEQNMRAMGDIRARIESQGVTSMDEMAAPPQQGLPVRRTMAPQSLTRQLGGTDFAQGPYEPAPVDPRRDAIQGVYPETYLLAAGRAPVAASAIVRNPARGSAMRPNMRGTDLRIARAAAAEGKRFADGGEVPVRLSDDELLVYPDGSYERLDGPGTEMSDDIYAEVPEGSYVINAESADMPGVEDYLKTMQGGVDENREELEYLNQMGLQRRYGYAQGGQVMDSLGGGESCNSFGCGLGKVFNYHPMNLIMDQFGVGMRNRNMPPPMRLAKTAYDKIAEYVSSPDNIPSGESRYTKPRVTAYVPTYEQSRARLRATGNPYLQNA